MGIQPSHGHLTCDKVPNIISTPLFHRILFIKKIDPWGLYDSNSIHAEPIPNRKKESIKDAYERVLRLLQRRGLRRPKLHRLDNEASQLLKEFMTDEDVNYQLTPAGLHRRNWAERAIQTFKNHFIAGLSSTHPDFHEIFGINYSHRQYSPSISCIHLASIQNCQHIIKCTALLTSKNTASTTRNQGIGPWTGRRQRILYSTLCPRFLPRPLLESLPLLQNLLPIYQFHTNCQHRRLVSTQHQNANCHLHWYPPCYS